MNTTTLAATTYDNFAFNPFSPVERFSTDSTTMVPFRHLVVSPMFAEEWHVRPPVYDLFQSYPKQEPPVNNVLDPRDWPYGQYLTTTNLLPREEKATRLFCNGLSNAIKYVVSDFTAHDIAKREQLSHIAKLKLARRYRQNCNDSFSPFLSN
jgi:hypothetical protein